MKKIILIPDSYKGTLSSLEVSAIMANSAKKIFPEAKVISVPIADGGEGTVAAFLQAVGGERVVVDVHGPYMEQIAGFYGLLPDGTAVIEMAAAAGLPLVGKRLEVGLATTYGVGELMEHALKHGAKKIILGLGGSATNDGGCGAAAALGAVFTKADGTEFVPTGATLKDIAHVDVSALEQKLQGIEVVAMCDITNELCGPLGAATVFGPQKGATKEQIPLLDAGLAHMADIIAADLDVAVKHLPGTAAAGGMGAGCAAFFKAQLVPGIEVVLNTVGFAEMLTDADVVFTGEGRVDAQSLMGKVLSGVTRECKQKGVPVICVAGAVENLPEEVYAHGLTAAFSINQKPLPFSEAAPLSAQNLAITMENILRLLKLNAKFAK